MNVMIGVKSLLFISSLVIVTHYLYNEYQKRKKKVVKTKIQKKEVHESLMFSKDDTINADKKIYISDSTVRLLEHLSSAQNTIDICMYLLTNRDIYNALVKLMYKGVKLRFITDADMAFSSGSYIKKLEKKGIVRWRKSANLMHHKFCLIDAQIDDPNVTPLLITGSMNWTTQAIFGNWESVVVTSQEILIKEHSIEFEKLWDYCKPIINS